MPTYAQNNRYTGDFNIVSFQGETVAQLRLTNHACVTDAVSEQGLQPYDRFRLDERFGASASAVRFNVSTDISGISEADVDVIVDAWEALRAEV